MDIPVGICPSQKAFLREQGAVQGAVPVEQGAADPLPVARDLHGIAAALAFGIAVEVLKINILNGWALTSSLFLPEAGLTGELVGKVKITNPGDESYDSQKCAGSRCGI